MSSSREIPKYNPTETESITFEIREYAYYCRTFVVGVEGGAARVARSPVAQVGLALTLELRMSFISDYL